MRCPLGAAAHVTLPGCGPEGPAWRSLRSGQPRSERLLSVARLKPVSSSGTPPRTCNPTVHPAARPGVSPGLATRTDVSGLGRPLDTLASPSTHHRQGSSRAAQLLRGRFWSRPPGSPGGGVPSSSRPTPSLPVIRSNPSALRSRPNAWQSFAGPEQSASARQAPALALSKPAANHDPSCGWPGRRPAAKAPRRHLLESAQRRKRTQQDSTGLILGPADDVRAVMHPVGEIDVQMPWWTEHGRVSGVLPLKACEAASAAPR